MIKVLFMFPSSVSSEQAEDIVTNHLIPANKQSIGFRSMSTSMGALMSPGGPVPYERIVEVNFDSLGDVMASAQSSAAQTAEPKIKALGVVILIFEVGSL